jgi:hypothetical protein
MTASDTRVPFAALSLIAAPALLTIADAMQTTDRFPFAFTVVLWAAFVCFVPAIFALADMARRGAPALATAGLAAALVGTMAGAAMQVLFRTRAVLESAAIDPAARDAALGAIKGSAPLALSTLVPGIFFPIGLLILAVALYRARAVPMWSAALLGLGAVLFPVGHAVGLAPALVGGDLVLLAALAPIGASLLRGARAPAAAPAAA